MGDKTNIEWCDATWNPVTGCSPTSLGCVNCWAFRRARRLAANPAVKHRERYRGFRFAFWPERLDQPRHWRKPRRIAVALMGDIAHGNMDCQTFGRIWQAMADAPQHTYMLLTKRPQHLLAIHQRFCLAWPPNIWLGVSVEHQAAADERLPALREIPALVRYVSCEPLLGPVRLPDSGLNWVIAGGESGPDARPSHPDWFRMLRDHCKRRGLPFFFKQWGAWTPFMESKLPDATLACFPCHRFLDGKTVYRVGKKRAGHQLDSRIWREIPADPSGNR